MSKQSITLSGLKKTWNRVKKNLLLLFPRDIIDWADEINMIDTSLETICKEIESNIYQPQPGFVYEVGKTRTRSRLLTMFHPKDLLVYRHISDLIYSMAQTQKIGDVYFLRKSGPSMFGKVFIPLNKMLISADISKYFGSIDHSVLFRFLSNIGLSRQTIDLLEKFFKHYSKDQGLVSGKGIPVDDFECHGQIAYVFLFPVDKKMVAYLGKGNYFRFLDDLYLLVDSLNRGKEAIRFLNSVLSSLDLKLNTEKTRFIPPKQIPDYFEYDFYNELGKSPLENIWRRFRNRSHLDPQKRDKVLQRLYILATKEKSTVLEPFALKHLIDSPRLDKQIFEYFALRNRREELYRLFEKYCKSGENHYEATEMRFFESVLLLHPSKKLKEKYRALARQFISDEFPGQTKRPLGKISALLVLYRFGEPPEFFINIFKKNKFKDSPLFIRSLILCIIALSPNSLPKQLISQYWNKLKNVGKNFLYRNKKPNDPRFLLLQGILNKRRKILSVFGK